MKSPRKPAIRSAHRIRKKRNPTRIGSPEQLSAEDRAQYQKALQAVDDFIANHLRYKQTDENRQAILEYLAEHDLAISPASLELCWEQLQDRLDLEPEQRGSEEQPESEEDTEESEPEPEEPKTARGKPVAWRNGRRLDVGA